MCGISGIIYPKLSGSLLRSNITKMTESIRHRGPDDSGVWIDESVGLGLGHRRLSILDLSEFGSQPMCSSSGRYIISFNGEIYNYLDLRKDLEGLNVQFRGSGDTEVLLSSIETWGIENTLDRLVGMFAFAVWDRENRELSLIRDRLGIKPLYWGQFQSLFIFGSEIRALSACSEWTPQIDRDSLASYSRWNYVPSPHSIYKGIFKLEPGTRLTIRPGEEPKVNRYWDLMSFVDKSQVLDISDQGAIENFESILEDSVKIRLASDVPLGAFLSGGIDSSLIVALMQKNSFNPVKTFTIGFEDEEFNEAKFAKGISEQLGTDHTELYVGPKEVLDIIPDLPNIYDEPFADSSQIPTTIISHLTRNYVKVALSGDGGDELLAGYTRYNWAKLIESRFLGLSKELRYFLASTINLAPEWFWEGTAQFVPKLRRIPNIGKRAKRFSSLLRESDANAIYRNQHTHWSDPELIIPNSKEPLGVSFDDKVVRQIPDFIDRMQFMDSVTYLPDDILTKLDRASMSVGLEARVPFLDHRVIEYSWKLPQRMKFRNGINKWITRQILYKYLNKADVDRPKMGFSVPLASWLRGPLRDWAESLLDLKRLRDGGLFNSHEVHTQWNHFIAGGYVNQEALWGTLMFEAWRDSQSSNFS